MTITETQAHAYYERVLGDRIKRRRSDEIQALCLFHEDRSPSLSVNVKTGLIYCHAGCISGDIFKFEMQRTGCSFPEAKRAVLGELGRKIVAEYDYQDESGKLLYQNVRYSPKEFRVRRLDESGNWIWNLNGTRRVLYNLPNVIRSKGIVFVEGEKDVDTATRLGFTGTTSGSVTTWKPEFAECLRSKRVAIISDPDTAGRKYAQAVAKSLTGIAELVKVVELPKAKDLADWVQAGGTREQLREIFRLAPLFVPSQDAPAENPPWDAAESMSTFLSGDDLEIDFLYEPLLARGCITEIFSPRGIGKSMVAAWLAIRLAKRGVRVLLLDRDNPRHVLRQRLRSWGADGNIQGLKTLSREKCPPLTNAAAWSTFPYDQYDLVIIDSLDSSAEGVGEQDSAKPSRAIAAVLDISRRENGPAVLILGNTVKSGSHSRGSGVVEDRADIVFEVRDATGFTPTGSKPWVEELPKADAGSWKQRATRRKGRTSFRLAFIPTKFRIGQEPEALVFELNLEDEPWELSDVTDRVDKEGAERRAEREQQKQESISRAAEVLTREIDRRLRAGEPPLLKDKDAVPILRAAGLTQKLARQLLKAKNGVHWLLKPLQGAKGKPLAVFPCDGVEPYKNENAHGNASGPNGSTDEESRGQGESICKEEF